MRHTTVVFALLVICGMAAMPHLASGEDQRCANANTTVDMVNCLGAVYEDEDARLNAVWQQIMADFRNPPDYMPAEDYAAWKDALLKAQRAWITYKDTDCQDAVGFEWYGGTGRPVASLSCLIEKTQNRRVDLEARYLPR